MREWALSSLVWVIAEIRSLPSGVMAAPISELTNDGPSQLTL